MALLKFGDYAVVWGNAVNINNTITKGKGTNVTTFSVQYGKDGDTKLYQNCIAWADLSKKYFNRLDKGDLILVIGRLVKDDYWSERNGKDEYKLVVEYGHVQELFDSGDIEDELDLNDI